MSPHSGAVKGKKAVYFSRMSPHSGAVKGKKAVYFSRMSPHSGAAKGKKAVYFSKGALLVDEFNHIFSNIFLRNSDIYRKIIEILSSGAKEFKVICASLKLESSGRILEYLNELELAGFVKRDYTWHLKTGIDAKLSQFRVCDNYLRFYLKYIDKYKTKIERNSFDFKSLTALPGWDAMIGLQFENLVLNNRRYLWQCLGLKPEDVVSENPYFQHQTTKQQGCQIDYLIQTRFGSLYVCEIKFSKHAVSDNVMEKVQQKIDRLKKPKAMSCRPVLIHINGVSSEVEERNYFAKIIDFSEIF